MLSAAEQSRAKSCWRFGAFICFPAKRAILPRAIEPHLTSRGAFFRGATSAIDVAGTHMVLPIACAFALFVPASIDRRNTSVPQTLAPDGEF
jgi:hypothetical protein